MVMAASYAKDISEAMRRKRRKEALEKYWDKVAVKQEGYIVARSMEIECVRIGRTREEKHEEKEQESNVQTVCEL